MAAPVDMDNFVGFVLEGGDGGQYHLLQ